MRILARHIVPENVTKKRLSDYVCGLFDLLPSRKGVKKAIKRGEIILDGKEVETGRWVLPGHCIELIEKENSHVNPFRLSIEIVLEDESIAVVNKPAGYPVSGNTYRTIENALPFNLVETGALDGLRRPLPVHRLDSSTSGLLLIAKTRSARMSLGAQFQEQTIQKRYRAVVMGEIDDHGHMDLPIDGKEASTIYQVIQRAHSLKSGSLALIDLWPKTGRTHQLRKHLAAIDHPILGDKLYGHEGNIFKGKGLFLAAVELAFIHPKHNDAITIKIDQPNKFLTFMSNEERRWRKYNASN